MLTDGRSEKLKKWLENTNWPENYEFEHKIKLVKNYVADELTIRKGLDSISLFLSPKRLTRSDFDYIIQSCIKNIEESSKTTLRYDAGKDALKK